ncbi:hypothetical protein FPSE_06730 [Fusarium pseudograminearum CS3096]|uniref:Uncharacterized protein n=1 Tax=Fusarium pseudograminearum (strain CS3096) TaxID=1028729 RepID=K3VFU5_FUSPC|nr:hypothetical protein FPSE_06730 [Fusarium pseudograminearum CS3096]EKJ73117.1 hypothetical protein FPSE_06730 [Fusarium pseudograminearum CS3096]
MPRDFRSGLSVVELDDFKNDVNQRPSGESKQDGKYSPVGDDDYSIATPSVRGRPTAGRYQSTESLIKDSSGTNKQSYWKSFKGPEAPKRVCKNGIWAVFRHLALFHIPPIGITLALLGLYVHKIRWGDLTEEQLNFLQFAAKAHEILILVSLTDILLQRICYSLMCQDQGVPLGLLSSPFQLGSPLQYFFSWELWSGIIQPGVKPKKARPWITGMVIIVTVLLSVAAAPLSAIVMIPREGWWQVHHTPDDDQARMTYFKPDIYPTDLGERQTDVYLIQQEADSMAHRPDPVLGPIFWDMPTFNMETNLQPLSNITYTNYDKFSASNRVITMTQAIPDAVLGLAVATTPMDTLSSNILHSWHTREDEPKDLLVKSYWRTLESPSLKRWKQPLVAAECAWNLTSGNESYFSFPSNMSSGEVTMTFDDDPEFKDLVTEARKMPKNKLPKARHRAWAPSKDASSRISANFLFLVETPEYFDNGTFNDHGYSDRTETSLGFQFCRVYARWAEVDFWVERGKSLLIQNQFDRSLFDIYNFVGDSAAKYEPIRMHKEWLESVGRRRNETGEVIPEQISIWDNSIDIAHDVRTRVYYQTAAEEGRYLQLALGVHLADILSRMGRESLDRKGVRPDDSIDGEPPEPGDYILEQENFLGGYGYSIESSSAIPLALGVLLLHVAIVLIHAFIIIFFRHRWLSSCWAGFGEVLVLALRSDKHDLGNVGGGVDSSQTWSTAATVRIVGEDGRLEMVLNNTRNGDGLIQGEGYKEEGGSTGYSRVEPGVKYR